MLSSSLILLTLISCNPNVQQDTELVLKLECHKVMQNYLPALSYLKQPLKDCTIGEKNIALSN